jgi:hypothetical protein
MSDVSLSGCCMCKTGNRSIPTNAPSALVGALGVLPIGWKLCPCIRARVTLGVASP